VIKGDKRRLVGSNECVCWDWVRLNLLGQERYDPNMPWASKVMNSDGRIVEDLLTFVDDFLLTGSSSKEQAAWQADCWAASVLRHLSIKDAFRNGKIARRPQVL
jgi:hypothetical protein